MELKVNITTKTYPSEELTIIANVKGSVKPNERFVYSAHVQEPGANDNATGVGTLAEMARLTAKLVKEDKLKPQRSLTFYGAMKLHLPVDILRKMPIVLRNFMGHEFGYGW